MIPEQRAAATAQEGGMRWCGSGADSSPFSRLLPWVILAGLVLRALSALRAPIIESDGAYYAQLADRLLRGDFHNGISTVWPPAYPALIAAVAWIPMRLGVEITPQFLEACARVVSVAAGTLLLFPLRAVALRLLPRSLADAACVLAAAHPRLIQYSGAALTESLFMLALVTAVWAAIARRPFLSGMAMGIAYLTRPEGAFLAAVLLTACAFAARGFRANENPSISAQHGRLLHGSSFMRFGSQFILGVAILAAPYATWVSCEIGQPSLGEKGAYNFWRTYQTEYARVLPEPEGLSERVSESRELTHAIRPVRVQLAEFVLLSPKVVFVRSLGNLGTILISSFPVAAYHLFFLLALLGVRRWMSKPWLPVIATVTCFPLLYAPFSVDRRFFVPSVPLLLIMSAAGLGIAVAWLSRVRSPHRDPRQVLLFLTFLVAALYLVYSGIRSAPIDDAPEHRTAGAWLRDHFEGGAGGGPTRRMVVMSRKPWVAYYAHGLMAELPDGPIEDVLDHARRKNVDFLVIDERFVSTNRPQLIPLLDPSHAPALAVLLRIERPRPIVIYDLGAQREHSTHRVGETPLDPRHPASSQF